MTRFLIIATLSEVTLIKVRHLSEGSTYQSVNGAALIRRHTVID